MMTIETFATYLLELVFNLDCSTRNKHGNIDNKLKSDLDIYDKTGINPKLYEKSNTHLNYSKDFEFTVKL